MPKVNQHPRAMESPHKASAKQKCLCVFEHEVMFARMDNLLILGISPSITLFNVFQFSIK
uniref:Uncharacterized protein n=1 Tax=Anguilla anguilla TaxID=7936 RepID=A0A0E9PH49_ANGAN